MGYLGNVPSEKFLTTQKDRFTGLTGSTVTLSHSVSSISDIIVWVNSVKQDYNSLSVSDTTLTLGGALVSDDVVQVAYIGRTVGTKAPADGTVTNDMLAGSITNSKLANSSITLNGSAVSLGGSANAGITMADSWRLTTSFTGDANPIASNLERVDTDGFGQLGTGMTESSGIFTFPSTGIYKIDFLCTFSATSGDKPYHLAGIATCLDGVTYSMATEPYAQLEDAGTTVYNTIFSSFIFDVTNTSTRKVRFRINASDTNTTTEGSSGSTMTGMNFIRLGDT